MATEAYTDEYSQEIEPLGKGTKVLHINKKCLNITMELSQM